MIKMAFPLLHVSNADAARDFYCGKLGFRLEFAHRGDESLPDPCYMSISRDGVWIHLSSFSGDGVAGGVVNLLVDDVDALHQEFVAKGVTIAVEPVDQTWGTREMYVRDADRNCLRFQC
jgi:catechol 2,3-dioxygenase-like lactoylglutathione lyase family enzyme